MPTVPTSSAVRDVWSSSPSMTRPVAGSGHTYYKMQGYRYDHAPPDVEIWYSVDVPNPINPSGEPIRGVRCTVWTA